MVPASPEIDRRRALRASPMNVYPMASCRDAPIYGGALHKDPSASLDDLREAVTTLEETERIARRVLGGAHPHTKLIGQRLGEARKKVQN